MSYPTRSTRSLLSIDDLSNSQVIHLIERAQQFKKNEIQAIRPAKPLIVGMVFFEASTRTRFSFEVAAHRLLLHPVVFVVDKATSVDKGESLHETLNTLLAMRPDLLVVRHAGNIRLEEIMRKSSIPVVNAGSGVEEHPTQSLLDAMTVQERLGQIEGQRILYVGDVEHSRVAKSGAKLFQKLGAQVAVCSPKDLAVRDSNVQQFNTLSEALKWCTVCIGLRIQKERHSQATNLSQGQYIENFRLDNKNLAALSSSAIIMHPGPFVPDVDLSDEVLSDSRCAIHEQVTNGVYMRMAIMGDLLGLSYT
ncbi:MAG: aspartate carbamoyltransferase catalytic subunit [Bdellovibrionales bacterium]|nr:aspartate carbamoyltransferase catalytic subunit [Bdellovibrionales bacterium]